MVCPQEVYDVGADGDMCQKKQDTAQGDVFQKASPLSCLP